MSPTTQTPSIVHLGSEIRNIVLAAQAAGQRVGLTPTMGALHDGHLSLAAAARRECDVVVATVFVNPTQFAPHEDYQLYPRDLQADAAKLAQCGCDYVFAPAVDEMYPTGFETTIDVGSIAHPLEGEHRPTHFAGVATVVLKLMNLVPANVAYFGQKDYQQVLVVRRMVHDLNVPTTIHVCPTVREPDGLAMSSRNSYLDTEERQRAAGLHASLKLAEQLATEGEKSAIKLRQVVEAKLAEIGGIDVEYVAFVRAGSIDPVETLAGPTVALIAARVGRTRLIDNLQIG